MPIETSKRAQGHPLKSFSVPGPPPATTPVITGSSKHSGKFFFSFLLNCLYSKFLIKFKNKINFF